MLNPQALLAAPLTPVKAVKGIVKRSLISEELVYVVATPFKVSINETILQH